MPIYDVECQSCGKTKEILVLSPNELESIICSCGGNYKKLPSVVTWRWMMDEGVWETDEHGQQKFKGKGGKKAIYGGETLDVHSGMPETEGEKPTYPKAKDGVLEHEKPEDFLKEMPE